MPYSNFSIFTPALEGGVDSSGLAEIIGDVLRATGDSARWQIATGGFWCSLTPKDHTQRLQGWKLHLSATILSAEAVLARVLPVLLKSRSAFKFASTLERVDQLNNRHAPRGHSGKFITIYPESDDNAVRLAEELHEVTAGLTGPRILSDRPYKPGSLVHYRYGAFIEERRLSSDGFYSWVIFDPDGNPVQDPRGATFLAPSWAPCPFPVANQVATDSSTSVDDEKEKRGAGAPSDGTGVLIGDRFLIRAAIRHANKGGVYRAVDTDSGADVVIKEARPHVGTGLTGKDVRDLLRAEARALELARPAGVAPRLLELFEQSQHVFLAEELVPGVPLLQWVADGLRNREWSRGVPGALDMAGRLVELMEVAHQAGLILGDFNPNNIMVRPDGELRIIDLELAVKVGEHSEESCRAATPGFGAPEQLEGARPTIEADLFSLGATICFVVTGAAPIFLADLPKTRSLQERLKEWLAVRSEAIGLPHDIQTLILGLMNDVADRRWTVSAARGALAAAQQAPQRAPRAHRASGNSIEHTSARLDDQQFDEAIEGCVGHLLATMNPADVEQLWPASCAYGAFDPCTVQLGAAGALGVLTRYFELTDDQRLPAAIATAGRWIIRRMDADLKRSGGLYFGGGGIAWSLYEAGRAAGDDRLVDQSLALADRLPVSSEFPDVTHGTAGIGLTFLHFWLRTANEKFAQRASRAADELIASVREESSGLIWTTPAAVDSRLAGGRYFGFAHGTAGVGYFLLATALATGRSDCLDLATRAGETLLANASVGQGAALWGASPGDDVTASYWCHGSAGIGSFLARLHRVTGDDRYAKMADLSAHAVIENAGRAVLGQCHGLAGNGDFLLDMAASADGQPYEAMAHELARVIFTCRAHRDGRVVFPDEHGDLSVSWAHGLSGILAFYLRLRHRSSRLWMVDSLLERSPRR